VGGAGPGTTRGNRRVNQKSDGLKSKDSKSSIEFDLGDEEEATPDDATLASGEDGDKAPEEPTVAMPPPQQKKVAAEVESLTSSARRAAAKGDVMPREAIAGLFEQLGVEVPKLSAEAEQAAEALARSGAFVCKRTGRPGTKLDSPPMRGPVGEWIQENISAETWQEWIGQGTKVINELRLDFSLEEHQQVYDQHMYEYLGIDEQLLAQLRD